jgi:hypothetical protein
VRRPEGRARHERLSRVDEPRHRVDTRHLERVARLERGQDARQTPGQHRLARARRAGEQEVVTPRGRDLERTPRPFLTTHVAEIELRRLGAVSVAGRRRLRLALAAKIRDSLSEMPQRHRLDAREGRLGSGRRRAEEPAQPGLAGGLGRGEHAADRPQASVERELSERGMAAKAGARDLAGGSEHRESDR